MLNKTRLLLATVLLVSGSSWLATPARADDLNPPNIVLNPFRLETWNRTDPLTTSAEWVFLAPVAPLAPNGTVPLHVGDYTGITGPTAIPGAGLSLGTLGWTNTSATDAIITFRIPNWVDNEPLKYLQIQTTFFHPDNEQGSPTVPSLAVTGYKNNLPGIFVGESSFSYEISTSSPDKHYSFNYYKMAPNPDWENIVMTIKPGYTVGQVVIDTISLPEPATASLLLIAGAVGLLRRRR